MPYPQVRARYGMVQPGSEVFRHSDRAPIGGADFLMLLDQLSDDLIWAVDADGRWCYLNETATRSLYGYERDQMLGRSFTEYLAPDRIDKDLAVFESIKRGKTFLHYDTVHLRKDGSPLHLSFNATVIRDASGQVLGTAGTARDLTQERSAVHSARRGLSILHAVTFAAEQFLQPSSFDISAKRVLAELGEAVMASRAYLFRNQEVSGRLCTMQIEEWTAEGVEPRLSGRERRWLDYQAIGFSRWKDLLSSGGMIAGPVSGYPESERLFLAPGQVKSMVVVPIFVGDAWWGFIGFSDINRERHWEEPELEALRAAANAYGAAVQRQLAEQQLLEVEGRYRTLVDTIAEGVMLIGADGRVEACNPSAAKILSQDANAIVGRPAFAGLKLVDTQGVRLDADQVPSQKTLRDGSAYSDFEMGISHPKRGVVWTSVSSRPLYLEGGDHLRGAVLSFADVTEQRRAKDELRHAAFHDEMTGLPNRAMFLNLLRGAMTGESSSGNRDFIAVLFVDIDRFKVLNDSKGHFYGDRVLKGLGRALARPLRQHDTLARLGGDEFTVLLQYLGDPWEAVTVATALREAVAGLEQVDGERIHVSASVGIAVARPGTMPAEHLLRDADIALHQAKARGRNCHVVFDETMHAQAVALEKREREVRAAVSEGRIVPYYQPLVNARSGQILGFEALARWLRRESGVQNPEAFLGLAEETRLIQEIDLAIARAALEQLSIWKSAGSTCSVNINVSSAHVFHPEFLNRLDAVIIESGALPDGLRVEITEGSLLQRSRVDERAMDWFRERNIGLVLDDFGTGYSSLSYLHELPLSGLKIDRAFVSRLVESPTQRNIVVTILSLAEQLGLEVVAEGIERERERDLLLEMGCELMQGFYFGRPCPASQATDQLEINR